MLTNIQTFVVIVGSHAASDLYRFEGRANSKAAFYWRQIVGTANYSTGNAIGDFLQGGINYQIEHHLFPDMTLSDYRRMQPRVKEICERHGIPLCSGATSASRAWMLAQLMVGRTSMIRATGAGIES